MKLPLQLKRNKLFQMNEYLQAILACLEIGARAVPVDELEICSARRLGKGLDIARFQGALDTLASSGQICVEGKAIRRTEPDTPEIGLEAPLMSYVSSEAFLQSHSLRADRVIFENTARGGPARGRWTRPDITLAAIRKWRFDPNKQLDVFSFELKNRAGTNIMAVHEALAHGRFAHFPYLACPNSARESDVDQIRQECAEHGVGLILFDIRLTDGKVDVERFVHDLSATRRAPDPERVEQYLSERLSEDAQVKLEKLAWGSV